MCHVSFLVVILFKQVGGGGGCCSLVNTLSPYTHVCHVLLVVGSQFCTDRTS